MKEQIKEEMFFGIGAPNMDFKEWQKLGEPITWFKMYEKDDITIWEDRAFGSIRLQVGKKVASRYDFVVVDNVVAFGPVYEGVLKTFVPYITEIS